MHVDSPHLASPPGGGEEYEVKGVEVTERADKPAAYLLAASNLRSSSLPRLTASSSAVLASFLPDHTDSSSWSSMSRICTKLPSRKPLELSVGGLSVGSF